MNFVMAPTNSAMIDLVSKTQIGVVDADEVVLHSARWYFIIVDRFHFDLVFGEV